MDMRLPNDKNQIQVIARAAAILRALEDETSGLSLGQIAQRVNLARSTVQRIVAALQTEKLVIAASPTGRVRLGPTIRRLAGFGALRLRVDRAAVPSRAVARAERDGRPCDRQQDHLVFIDQVIGPQRLRTVSAVGEMFPLYCTANGKAYLAGLADDEVAPPDRQDLRAAHAEDRSPVSPT